MPDFELALQGNYQQVIDSRAKAVLTGLRHGTQESSAVTKDQMRRDIRAAGFGNRLALTVQDTLYPKSGLSFSPVALVYSKAPHILSTHTDGAKVGPEFSKFLAVPISDGPAAKMRKKRGATLIETFWERYGNDSLHFVDRPGKSPILVAKLKRSQAGRLVKKRSLKPLKVRQGPRTNKGENVTIPVFTLVKNVQHKKRLDLRQIMEKGRRRHPARLAFHLQKSLAASNAETALR